MKIVLNRVIFYDVMINIQIQKKLKYFLHILHSTANKQSEDTNKQNGTEKYDICER
jgi:hypothetical protein